jgi:serpin B
MNQTGNFKYSEAKDFQSVEIPYKGGDLTLVAFLPRETFGIAALEKKLTSSALRGWLDDLQTREVSISFPKFKMTQQFELAKTLQTLGMTDAFNLSDANFSLMDGHRDLSISHVIHKAFVEANEEGTEAAAATAVFMHKRGRMGPPPPIFQADHPFLFLIRDLHSGAILFLGRVADPRA